jgi:hypothetical protein
LTHPISWPAGFIIPPSKVTKYLLNLHSRDGASKATFFLGHGFEVTAPLVLADVLFRHTGLQNFVGIRVGAYGHNLTFEGPITTPNGTMPRILSAWFVSAGGDGRASLATAYPI